jgi:hypothetical protein
MARTSVIETESPEWHSGARPSSYVRIDGGQPWNRTRQAQRRRLYRPAQSPDLTLPLDLVADPGVAPGSTRLMRPPGYLTDRPAIKRAEAANSPAAPAYIRPGAIFLWRRAEDLSLTPCGAIGVRSRAGAPVRLTLQDWDDASSNRHPNLSSCLIMISAQTRSAFVARENRCPLCANAGPSGPDHALARA